MHAPGSPISLEKKVRSAEILHPPASFTWSRGIPKRTRHPHRLASQVEIRSNGVRLEAPSSVHFSPGRTQRAAPQRAARRCSLRAIPGPGCSQPPPQPQPPSPQPLPSTSSQASKSSPSRGRHSYLPYAHRHGHDCPVPPRRLPRSASQASTARSPVPFSFTHLPLFHTLRVTARSRRTRTRAPTPASWRTPRSRRCSDSSRAPGGRRSTGGFARGPPDLLVLCSILFSLPFYMYWYYHHTVPGRASVYHPHRISCRAVYYYFRAGNDILRYRSAAIVACRARGAYRPPPRTAPSRPRRLPQAVTQGPAHGY